MPPFGMRRLFLKYSLASSMVSASQTAATKDPSARSLVGLSISAHDGLLSSYSGRDANSVRSSYSFSVIEAFKLWFWIRFEHRERQFQLLSLSLVRTCSISVSAISIRSRDACFAAIAAKQPKTPIAIPATIEPALLSRRPTTTKAPASSVVTTIEIVDSKPIISRRAV